MKDNEIELAKFQTENAHLRQVIAEALTELDGWHDAAAAQILREALKPKKQRS